MRLLVIVFLAASCGKSEKPAAQTSAPATAQAPADASPDATSAADVEVAADTAYQAKQWDRCAELYTKLTEQAPNDRVRVGALYNAACCQALGSKKDAAFTTLDKVVAAGWSDRKHVEADADLATLRSDARWTKLVQAVQANADKIAARIKEPALRNELLALVQDDQRARKAYIANQQDEAARNAMMEIDAKTTARMKQVVAKHGWPGASLVGEDGANAAWLLVQHADKDRKFQRECLAKMEPMVKTGEVSARNYAYLYDRVAVADKRPQRWGTQFEGDKPFPIEDEANVDARRKAIGLPTMAEYAQEMRAMYGGKK